MAYKAMPDRMARITVRSTSLLPFNRFKPPKMTGWWLTII